VRFADAPAAQSAHARLLASGIAVSTLEPYDMADWLRISVGLPEHNRAVLDALA
jgi:histidinol-phosphate aminotransferase